MKRTPQEEPLVLLLETRSFVVVDKPSGLTCHSNQAGRPDLLSRLARRTGTRAKDWHLVHRLDRESSGCTLVARSGKAHAALDRELRAGRIERLYLACVEGPVEEDEGTIDAPIARDRNHETRRCVRADGSPARTHWKVESRSEHGTWLACRLDTGRTHQIRVHLAHWGHPLLGDALYGGRMDRFPRLALHAARLTVPNLDRRAHEPNLWVVEAPLPEELLER